MDRYKNYVSLPLAIKMQALGFSQEDVSSKWTFREDVGWFICADPWTEKEIAAYSVCELGSIIRRIIQNQGKSKNKFFMECIDFEHCCWSDNEADARAMLLIMLKEKYPSLKV